MRTVHLRTLILATGLLALAAPASAQPRLPADIATQLSGDVARIAADVPDEGTPEPDTHYPVSNEWRHDLWFPHVRDLGGAFVGVGSDQCYTLAAVQNASMLWLVDFDPVVPRVHRMYGVLVPASPTPAELVARFAPENAAATEAMLTEALSGEPETQRAVLRLFRRERERLARYLTRISRLSRDGAPTTWLSDATLYARVRALFQGGRVIARNGDVTGERTLRAIGAAARSLGVPVRVYYLSNAEQFFPYTQSFVANVDSLPGDERSVVLRTYRHRRAVYPHGDRWHYVVHRWSDFGDRLHRGYRHSRQMVADLVSGRGVQGADGLTVIDGDTPRRAPTYTGEQTP